MEYIPEIILLRPLELKVLFLIRGGIGLSRNLIISPLFFRLTSIITPIGTPFLGTYKSTYYPLTTSPDPPSMDPAPPK